MNITEEPTPTIAVNYPAYTPSKEQAAELQIADERITRIDAILNAVRDLQNYGNSLVDALANGEAELETVLPLISQLQDLDKRKEAAASIRGPLKRKIAQTLATVQPVFDAERAEQAKHVAKLANDAEKAERKMQEKAGLHADEYQPSRHVVCLRATHKQLIDQRAQPSHRGIQAMLENQ